MTYLLPWEPLCQSIYASVEKKPLSDWDTRKAVSREAIDEMEDMIKKAGYPVLNSSADYPAFLERSEEFYAFWNSVQNGVDAETSYWEVSDSTADTRNLTPQNGSYTSGYDRGRCVVTSVAENPALVCAWLDQMYAPCFLRIDGF